jgi:hypothetical protein
MPDPLDDPAEIARRFVYHPPNEATRDLHDRVRELDLEHATTLVGMLPPSRERSLAVTALEEAGFWAHAAIARNL